MMDCREFKKWLAATEFPQINIKTGVSRHMATCDACRQLYDLDTYAESQVRVAFAKEAPTADFYPQIQASIDHKANRPANRSPSVRRPAWALPAVALASFLLILIINPFAADPITLSQVEHIVVNEHLRTDLKMDVRFDSSQSYQPWLSSTFDYAVALPDLNSLGLHLKGARVCNLAGRKAVYLICENSGKKTSVFIIHPPDVGFSLSPDKRYRIVDRALEIEMWEHDGLFYVTVSSAPQEII